MDLPKNKSEMCAESAQTDHLIRLPGSEWALWRWVGLRGAGFPAVQVRQLSAATCAARADALIQAQARAQSAQDAAMAAMDMALDALRAAQEWDNRDRREPLLQARHLKRGQLPEQAAGSDGLDAFRDALAGVAVARSEFLRAFDEAQSQVSQTLAAMLRADRFREALIWQNRRAFHSGVEDLAKREDHSARASKQRQNEELVASYMQRYCVKNDTIGFFGPVGWARLVPHGPALTARPGAELLAARTVSFEQWCIDELAVALAQNKRKRGSVSRWSARRSWLSRCWRY
jgi:hypothetical protein